MTPIPANSSLKDENNNSNAMLPDRQHGILHKWILSGRCERLVRLSSGAFVFCSGLFWGRRRVVFFEWYVFMDRTESTYVEVRNKQYWNEEGKCLKVAERIMLIAPYMELAEEALKVKKDIEKLLGQKFPANIDTKIRENEITLTIPDRKTTKEFYGIRGNVQTDDSAFEAWCLALRQACPECKIRIEWTERFNEQKIEHYNRFLYRVFKFDQIFGGADGWFEVDPSNLRCAKDIWQKIYKQAYLNAEKIDRTEKRNTDNRKSLENHIENLFNNNMSILARSLGYENFSGYRQFPVGLFKSGEISHNNRLFTGGKSAIDLWGIHEDELCIFELKAPGNKKIGIVSELFFYIMLILDLVAGNIYSDKKDIFEKITKIRAIFLVPDIHPAINKSFIDYLNLAMDHFLKKQNDFTRIQHVKFEMLKYVYEAGIRFVI